MHTLALDTSTSQGGVAVLEGERVLSRSVWSREKSHSEFLTPNIEKCLSEAGLEARSLDRIAVGRGPGSFTGIRIAINAARTLAYALSKPVYAFDTMEILAAGTIRHDLPLAVMLNAHKNLIYLSRFEWKAAEARWVREEGEIEALSLEEIAGRIQAPHLCIGDAYEEYDQVLGPGLRELLVRDTMISDSPLPEVLGQMAASAQSHASPLDWNALQALYIRASGAEEKLRESRVIDTSKKK